MKSKRNLYQPGIAKLLVSPLILTLNMAATTTGSATELTAVQETGGRLDSTCTEEEGELLHFSLEDFAEPTQLAEVGLQGEFHILTRMTRLDVCFDGERATLKGILTWVNQMGAGAWTSLIRALVVENPKPSGELAEAIFTDNYASIEIPFINLEDPAGSYVLKGWSQQNGRNLLTVSSFDSRSDLITVSPKIAGTEGAWRNQVDAGRLLQKDPFKEAASWRKSDRKIESGPISLKMKFSIAGSHGTRISYKFNTIEIKDQNLAGDAGNQFFSADQLLAGAGVLTIQESHHSLNDGFVIQTPEVEYSILPNQDRLVEAEFGYFLQANYRHPDLPTYRIGLDCGRVYQCGDILRSGGFGPPGTL